MQGSGEKRSRPYTWAAKKGNLDSGVADKRRKPIAEGGNAAHMRFDSGRTSMHFDIESL
jgi:hypothetical protein